MMSIDVTTLLEYVPLNKEETISKYLEYWNTSIHYIQLFITNKNQIDRINACKILMDVVHSVTNTEYLLIDAVPRIPKHIYIDSLFNLGTLLKNIGEEMSSSRMELLRMNQSNPKYKPDQNVQSVELEDKVFQKSLQYFNTILSVDFDNPKAIQQIVSVYTQLTFFNQHNLTKCVEYLNQALFHTPNNPTIHYNLGFVYQKLNNLHSSVIHYKTSIHLLTVRKELKQVKSELKGGSRESRESRESQESRELKESEESRESRELQENKEDLRLLLNNYNGIASIYRAIKQWPEALYYLLKAHNTLSTDPDINNQLGVAYTEMRRTDLAENSYKTAIQNYKSTFISTDPTFLLSEIYLNYGHMHSYNGDNSKSIECYNEALKICPKFMLPFQNKIMNLNYLFDELPDKSYITKTHKLINKLYKKGNLIQEKGTSKGQKINIGIVSGDFVSHPVSFFINTFLSHFDHTRFNVICYSEAIIDTQLFNTHLKCKLIKNLSQDQAANLILNDRIHILLDLSGHTALNRLDIFAMRPAPIQITYLGYPFTTGLNEMDYRITDEICDNLTVSQPFYTEKLIFLKDCFLNYDPTLLSDKSFSIPSLIARKQDGYLTIACFNRLNKITNNVIRVLNTVLVQNNRVKLVFKTKALLNKKVQETFLSKFDSSVIERITILDCTLSHLQHLETYNLVDIAIDTFPYSGTTTTCESLLMGVPVFSIHDSTHYFHPQNVSCSILKNSQLDEYICSNEEDLYSKIKSMTKDTVDIQFKERIRNTFLKGKVCQKEQYMKNIQDLFIDLFNKLP